MFWTIASIIVMEPKVIIYDEPSSNLDMRARRNLISFIKSGKETKLVSSHDLEFILETCSRIIILDNGKIVADGRPGIIMDDMELMLADPINSSTSRVKLRLSLTFI